MPLVSDPAEVREVYQQAVECGCCLANFCTANPRTTEAIFRAVHAFGQAHGRQGLPVVLSATGNYPIEPQLQHYTGTGKATVGMAAWLSDVETFLSEDSPYRHVRVLLHFDHAMPGYDDELIPMALGRFSTIMFDCSTLPVEENIRRVREFVEAHRNTVLVEGAVEKVVQAADAGPRGDLTDPDLAEMYLRETGAFLLVPNLGTEHRATADVAHYDGARARAIRNRVGPRMVLHGSSSLRDADLPRLAGDGIVKVNIWSIFERLGGQALARDVLTNLGNLFTAEQLRAWQSEGWLGSRFSQPDYIDGPCKGALGPKGWALVEHRRRNVWQDAVVARMIFYMEQIGYLNWRG